MTFYVKGSYGDKVYINMGEDLSSATNLNLYLIPEVGEIKERTPTVGASNINVEGVNLIANEYLEYTTIEGDLDIKGLWNARGFANTSASSRIVRNTTFRVT